MPLIDYTYFKGNILLVGFNSSSVSASIEDAIAEFEEEYLQKTMGPSLCVPFVSGLANPIGGGFSTGFSSGFDIGAISDRWLWIRDGHTYTYGGRTYIWPGLVNATLKRSPIADYVYWQYRAGKATETTQVAETTAKTENATVVSPDVKMVKAWNRMAYANRDLAHMLYHLRDGDNVAVYPEFNTQEPDNDLFSNQNVLNI